MEAETPNSCSIDATAEPIPRNHSSFARDESGQISVFVVLCVIPFIFLVAFIFNSAKQTSRKMEMQGAADSAAVAGAVTVARGMNFMVLNNNAMAEVLALMIAVRSVKNTARIMAIYTPFKAAAVCIEAAACLGFCVNLDEECADLTFDATPRWIAEASKWSSIDNSINNESSGMGWRVLDLLDHLNQISKVAFSVWAGIQAREYARKNGADLDPAYGFMLGGKSASSLNFGSISISPPIPTFPLARGPEQAIAFRVEACQYKFFGLLNGLASLYVVSVNGHTAGEALALYQVLRWANINHLKGDWGTLGNVFSKIFSFLPGGIVGFLGKITGALGQFLGIEILGWRDNPPKPMLLTDDPTQPTTDQREVDENARNNLRPYLQYLGIALGRVPKGSPIGGERFLNKPNSFPDPFAQMQFTYAQAEVYNPTKWDMWTQDWRAQLTRSKLFDEKINSLLQFLPLGRGIDWSSVNSH